MCIPYKENILSNIFPDNNNYDNNENIIIVNEK